LSPPPLAKKWGVKKIFLRAVPPLSKPWRRPCIQFTPRYNAPRNKCSRELSGQQKLPGRELLFLGAKQGAKIPGSEKSLNPIRHSRQSAGITKLFQKFILLQIQSNISRQTTTCLRLSVKNIPGHLCSEM